MHSHNLQHLNHQQPSPNRLQEVKNSVQHQYHHDQHVQHLQQQQQQQLALQQPFDQGGYEPSLNIDQIQFATLLQQQQQQQQQNLSAIDSPMSNPYDLRSGVPSQYLLPQQLGTFNTAPQYYQDPYLSIPIQASPYMQPFYGMAPAHNLLYHQIQQQQQLSSSPGTSLTGLGPSTQNPTQSSMNKQNGRPLTPQQQHQNSQQQQQQQDQNLNPYAQSSFSYYPPYTAFDPTGGASAAQLMMSNSRSINSNVRLISPMLINANGSQSKNFSSLILSR